MVFDCHIHMNSQTDSKTEFTQKLQEAGVKGGLVFSPRPASFDNRIPEKGDSARRLAQVLEFTKGNSNLFPFYFIDPMEPDAEEQVEQAVDAGIRGFKAICCHHYPQDDRAMQVWEHIAKKGKPLLFHSGILYNDGPSADFNRPGNFEHLLYIANLRFAVAHISWPWVDELIAVYGKFNSWRYGKENSRMTSELFVDLTPGTPGIYREDALRKLLTVGYASLKDHIFFGTDGSSKYSPEYTREIVQTDREIYDRLGVSQTVQQAIFCDNLLRFVGQ